jgi:hypothetical protein
MVLATCFNYCSRGLPIAFFPNIAPSKMFTTNSLFLIICSIHMSTHEPEKDKVATKGVTCFSCQCSYICINSLKYECIS